MKRLMQFGSVLLLLAGSAPVLAQDTSSSAETSSSTSSMATDTSLSAEFATVDEALIAALEAGLVADLATVTETSSITLVRVSDLKANGGADALEDIVAKVGDGAAMLKANVETNAVLKDKINATGFETDLVVAVLVNDAGSFTVIINDEHP